MGYMLINPIRHVFQNPDTILSRYVSQNMKVLDIGSAMGFFSLPMARLVGEHGKVVCVDLQEKMIEALVKRSEKAGLNSRMETCICGSDSLKIGDIKEEIDFALAFAVVHEVADKKRLFSEILSALKPGGRLLIAEPKGHVEESAFKATVSLAQEAGFGIIEHPTIRGSHSTLLGKTPSL